MGIKYPVPPGTMLLCDYGTGFQPPEMVKRRPVVVISPRLPHRDGLCTVVPLSTTAPAFDVPYVCRIDLAQPLPAPFTATTMWAKADMVATVAFWRLDLFRTARDASGKRTYLRPLLPPTDLQRVRACVLHAIGWPDLTPAGK
jgi:uncharacterized protein YifN (PemK superfamily)